MLKKINALFKLLDDSDPQTVHKAMAELLKYGDDILPYLAEHHEAENPVLRRHIHQLESIITLRRRRAGFAKMLDNPKLPLIRGLMEVHLQWYDNDSVRSLEEQWEDFMEVFKRYNPWTLSELAYYMRKNGFIAPPPTDIHADHFCLGPVLEEHVGADFIIYAIVIAAASEINFDLRIARLLDEFILIDNFGNGLTIRNNWQQLPNVNIELCEFWDKTRLLKLASLLLFQYAVSSDSFRYISTIGHSLLGLEDDDPLDFLPYPYHPQA